MKVALAGNPNCGKTTLFNALTGSTAHVGNWPGVTVDKREGQYRKKGARIDIVDLPGIYSLSPYTPEEVVSRNFIIDDKPDVIVNVVDSTNLERNLYLTTQILELDRPVVIALNMTDVLQKRGQKADAGKLSEVFGVPVVEISALQGKGLDEMMRAAAKAASSPRKGTSVVDKVPAIAAICESAREKYQSVGISDIAFRSVKAIENDSLEKAKHPRIVEAVRRECNDEADYEAIVADARYKFISDRCKDVVSGKREGVKLSKSDKIDRVLTHRIWGIPLFLLIMFAVFHLTFSEDFLYLGAVGAIPEVAEPTLVNDIFGNGAINAPGTILFNLMDIATSKLGEVIAGAMPEGVWYASLVNDGIVGGVFSVLSFIPQILVLFLFLSILEDSGYMARVAFIMDRAFRKFGLSGKSFLPLLMCFGCAVPGIMATKTLEDDKERRMTILLAPFFSCGAKLPIWAAFGAILFGGEHSDLIVYGMYILGIAVAIVSAIILKKLVFKGEASPFIMELPEYHRPQFRNTMVHLWQKLKHYLFRAATIIAGATVVIWFLTNISFTFKFVEDQGDSIRAARIRNGRGRLEVCRRGVLGLDSKGNGRLHARFVRRYAGRRARSGHRSIAVHRTRRNGRRYGGRRARGVCVHGFQPAQRTVYGGGRRGLRRIAQWQTHMGRRRLLDACGVRRSGPGLLDRHILVDIAHPDRDSRGGDRRQDLCRQDKAKTPRRRH